MIIDLDENGIGAIVAVLDLALKGCGIQARHAVNVVHGLLEAAKLVEIAAIEAAKLAETAELNDAKEANAEA